MKNNTHKQAESVSGFHVVTVQFAASGLISPRKALRQFSEAVLLQCIADYEFPATSITVIFCSKKRIHQLNIEFLGEDHATDVLSFPFQDAGSDLQKVLPGHLGDIALCLEVTSMQAPQGRTLAEEVRLLLVHAFLHLVGYDHDTEPRRKRMWKETDRIISSMDKITLPQLQIQSKNNPKSPKGKVGK